jgi:chromosome segregation ATPase
MGSIQEVKQALSAKAMTASLDDLRSRGRNQVRIIRAEHVAQMVAEAVERALADSGLVPHEELERLVQKSQSEFSAVKAERQRDLDESHRLSEALREAQAVLTDTEARSSELEQRFQDAQARASQAEFRVLSLEERLASLEGTRLRAAELEPEMQRTLARLHEAELELEAHRKQVKQREPELASATRRAEEQEGRAKVAEAKAGQALRDLESARLRVESLEQRLDAESQKFTLAFSARASTSARRTSPRRCRTPRAASR